MFVFCLFLSFRKDDGVNILTIFIKSGLHGIPGHCAGPVWPKKTVIVCLIEYSPDTDESKTITIWNIPKYYRTKAVHAEPRLIDYIKKEEDLTKIKRLTIYINYSPCTDCGNKLMELKQKFPNMQIKVIFSALYNQRRPSCEKKDCPCKEGDLEAIKKLNALDAQSIKKEDWDCLIKLLEHKGHPPSVLHGIRFGDDYEGWRNGEDKQLTEDYKEMSEEVSKNTPGTPDEKTSSTGEPPRPSKGDQATGSTGDGKSRKKLEY